jgi:hypothetical protein
MSVWCKKFKNGRTALITEEEQGPQSTDKDFVVVESLLREDRSVRVRETRCKTKCAMLHIAWKGTLGEGMFKLVKGEIN